MHKKVRIRTIFIGGVFTLFFIVIIFKMYWVQVADRAFWLDQAEKNWSTHKTIEPVRGMIVDRNNKVLAKDAVAYTVTVNPEIIHKLGIEEEIIANLKGILNISETKLRGLVTAKKNGVFLKNREIRNEGWKVDSDTYDRVIDYREKLRKKMDQNNVGIYFVEEARRFYPKNELGVHVLGYINKEGKPVYGLESLFNKNLVGIAGTIEYEKDAKGNRLPEAKVEYNPAHNGENIQLTIDENIQHYVEEAMQTAYDTLHPKSMTVIAADPNTMEILALANMPNYNPNEYWSFSNEGDFYNHALGSRYEPGSTFKIVTLAAAVEEGVFNPNDTYESGRIKIPGGYARDIKRSGWGQITYLEGLKRSSNVAFVKLGYEKLGEEKLKSYIDKFGFGVKTNIDLPGEDSGIIRFSNRADPATATYGQGGVQVTAIQQVTAIAAVANGGKLMWPHVVKQITDSETGKVLVKNDPKLIRQVISEKSSKLVGEYLEQVVSDPKIGTGRKAYIEGYRVAGKTGTAQKVINGKYSDSKYVVSFIGYAPVEAPKIVVYVLVDEPDVPSDQGGGYVAAPIFKDIVSQSLRYMNVPSTKNSISKTVVQQYTSTVPNVINLQVKGATDFLKEGRYAYKVLGSGTTVIKQVPAAGSVVSSGQTIYLLTEAPEKSKVPDMSGLPLQDSLQICTLLNLSCETTGEGYVVSQNLVTTKESRKVKLALQSLSKTMAAVAASKP